MQYYPYQVDGNDHPMKLGLDEGRSKELEESFSAK